MDSNVALSYFKQLEYGVLIYIENDASRAVDYFEQGVYGVFSDYISYEDLKAFE
jgi:hypothetical protein